MKTDRFALTLLSCLLLSFFFCSIVNAQTKRQEFFIVTGSTINDTLQPAIKDLQAYISKAVPGAKTSLQKAGTTTLSKGTAIVLVDEKDKALNNLAKSYGITQAVNDWNSFVITTFPQKKNPANLIYFLQGADALGKQYAVYDLVERLLGVRYLLPDEELVPVQKNFKPFAINTKLQKPDYQWRGLYPWNYNYNSRGLTTFCDINARFVNKDWAWYKKLGDWMIKNKQNVFLWFDDVFAHQNISGQFPDAVSDYYASRGIKQVLGLGWASNEDLTVGGEWKRKYCLNAAGKSVEDASWKRSICPMAKEYFQLADTNFKNMRLNKPRNYLGALIGYGENTWAAYEKGVNCALHSDTPSSSLILRDLKYVSEKFAAAGLADMPLGYVTSTHSIKKGTPFETDALLNSLPKNAIFSMHTYQQSGWRQFENLYKKMDERNRRENANMKAFHIGEVAFLCGADIPLVKPSILRRRSEHFTTLPKEATLGHLATLNTTQYSYGYNTYQMLRWQWHRDEQNWSETNLKNFTAFFGSKTGERLNEIFNRLACLEYVLPYTYLDSLVNTPPDLRPPARWGRYNPKTHPTDFGFLLWADVKELSSLEDAEKSIAAIIKTNEALNKTAGEKYSKEFYAPVRLTAHYYAIRVHTGKHHYNLNAARQLAKNKGWNSEVETMLSAAKKESEAALRYLVQYNKLLPSLLKLSEKNKKANDQDLARDFVQNPTPEFFAKQVAMIVGALKAKLFSNR